MSTPLPSQHNDRPVLDRITIAICLAVVLFFALAVVPSIISSHSGPASHTVEANHG
ncbi:MAG: hypothetical protein JJU26_13075 [Oceanicaulis sp.]|uniref:hypothetical protein n=1 Tax=Glycocaulis sp. TaxID=1969725 RepID=UPI0025BAA2E0|nr:hypothetical protein [Glycocaulis sp.]MCC5982638.1 hypothetical protein [Oceanicaulis sp.]MCH8522359.1 hypothetical protein [Glycocaulis sp.]